MVGETPNLAARLQALAAPNTRAWSPTSTRRLIGGLFETRGSRSATLEGFAEPQQVWRVSAKAAS